MDDLTAFTLLARSLAPWAPGDRAGTRSGEKRMQLPPPRSPAARAANRRHGSYARGGYSMRSSIVALLIAGILLATGGRLPAQAIPPAASRVVEEASQPLRVFFVSDVHSNHDRLERFIEAANRERPDLVLDGGDLVHDGTEAEFRRAFADRSMLLSPWYAVKGNHDDLRRGPFSVPVPDFPDVSAFERRGVHFVLLDNHEGTLSEEQFQRLEAELAARSGERILVIMHVPAVLGREPALAKLRHLLPFRLESPVMPDREQVERFTTLMERHDVLAVLSGHTHAPGRLVRGGVQYIVAGAAGGLTPGLGIANEYVEITIEGREVRVRRVALGEPARDPVTFLTRAFRFYADLNGFNHARQGWSYVPSASVQWKAALRAHDAPADESVAMYGAASFERLLDELGRHSLVADVGLSVGGEDFAVHLVTGYKLRPAGDYNENLFLSGATTANAGLLAARATAGLGAQLGVGFEWRGFTAEVSRGWATNHRSTGVAIGRRF